MVKYKMTTIFKEIFNDITLNREQSRAHEEEVEISETHTTENFDIKGTGPRDTKTSISANDIKASNGRTSGNALHPLTDKIYPTCTSARRPQDRVDRMSSAHEVEEIPNTYLTPKEEFLDIEEDDDQIDEFIEPTPYENLLNEELRDINCIDEDVDKVINNIPDEECKRMAKEILNRHKTVFRDQLPAAPAKLEPFQLELKEDTEWYTSPKNKQAPRLQTLAKQYEVNKFLEKAISNNIIRPSQATAWSQLLLTPKPNGKWRVCMDFRSLNTQTKSMGWPIPNIKDMINKIGSKR